MDITPKTYNDIKRLKQCYYLTKYYHISEELFKEIYDFLRHSEQNGLTVTKNMLSFIGKKNVVKTYSLTPKFDQNNRFNSYEHITIDSAGIHMTPHHSSTHSNRYYYDNSYSSTTTNNTNNNNNNNNNNNTS